MSIDSTSTSKSSLGWNPWVGFLIGLPILYGSQLIVGIALSIYPLYRHWNSNQAADWLNNSIFAQFLFVLLAESLAIVLVLLYLKKSKPLYRKIGLRKPKLSDPLWGIAALPAYLIIYGIVVGIVSTIDKSLNINQKQQLGFNHPHGLIQLILTFLALVIFPPIAEEILFRGLTYTSLKRIMPITFAAILTSILFSLPHLSESGTNAPLYIAGIDTFTLSLILIYLREKTGGLYSSMTLHGLKNAIAFTALFALHIS